MKITSVEIHPTTTIPATPHPVILSFRDPLSTRPYKVKKITGLDADDVVSKFYRTSGDLKFYKPQIGSREIVISAGLNPNYETSQSYSDLRDALYKVIAVSRTGGVQLKFKNDTVVVAVLNGRLSKLQTDHFDKVQEVQITIQPDDPVLKAPLPLTIADVGTLDPALTFINDTISTAPHGFTFKMRINAVMASITISDPYDDSWSFRIAPVTGFDVDDVLVFSSEDNNKYLYVGRAGGTIQLVDAISTGSSWPIIFPGQNRFSFSHSGSMTWAEITHTPNFWGV